MSMASVTTRGFGNGTFAGSMNLVVTLGYGIGAAEIDYAITRRGTLIGASSERRNLIGQSSERRTLTGQSSERRTLTGYDS
jgi:hypothetical protein